ncbi:hypothetical protein EKE94_03195 [Mesobaculum littorinae]|uniref:Phage tail protein n=1 Tax=Mesobaculum littorinae TaxID=2486419 RepID=A0A438ALH3_9RHOB|nr:phage tail tube protein [Mesobaculum littorinae]RVV99701.1 hypothetical protein EKE94_03195 [Mesobaculum littorinae]
MATKSRIAYGATVERSLDGTTWEKVPEAKGIAVPTVETDYQEATSLDSPNGFKEYVKGLKDAGTISIPCNYTPAAYEQQLNDQAQDDPIYYRTTLPKYRGQTAGDTFEFRGFPTPQLEQNGVGDIVAMSVSIRTSGDVTWTKGTAGA